MAPFERKDQINQDIDSRSFRKKLQGRLRKHIGDLCLLAGMPQEALTAYHSALDTLRVSQGNFKIGPFLIYFPTKDVFIKYFRSSLGCCVPRVFVCCDRNVHAQQRRLGRKTEGLWR